MNKDIRFAIYAVKKNIQSSAELRTSFVMNVFGMAINNVAFLIMWVYFAKSVGIIGGWTYVDVVGMQGFVALSFGIVFSICGGIRKLPDYVASGTFDSIMLSPKNLLIRVATSSFNVSAFGDIVFGIACLATYCYLTNAGPAQILLTFILVFFSMIVFLSAAITVYSTSFLFLDSSTLSASIFELFLTPALFHGGAFQGAMRFIFLFIIPSLLVGTIEVEAMRNISADKIFLLMTLSVFWLVLSVRVFFWAIKKYESSNYMNFGS